MTANICAKIIRPGIIKSFKYEKFFTQATFSKISFVHLAMVSDALDIESFM